MFKAFKEFMLRGNLPTIVVGLIMALATLALIEALVRTLISPMIAAIVGEANIEFLSFRIGESEFFYGAFINAAITFALIAAAIYYFVILPDKANRERNGVSAETRSCPECTSSISAAAKRCPRCTATVLPESA